MSVDLQKRIKDDQEDLSEYVDELVKWETEIEQKDEELKRKALNAIPCFPPVRGTKESEVPRMSEKEEKALQEKELGNTAFKRGKLEVAIRHYTKSLEYWPGSAVVYSNRAQVYLKQKEWNSANKDATTAIKLTSTALREQCNDDNVKAYFRRATARIGLQLYNQAKSDLQAILAFDPMHKEARQELQKVEAALRQKEEELEEKRGRKKLVIQEVEDEDEDEDETPAPRAAKSSTPPPPVQKKGRTVVIEEVDDDDEVEDVPVNVVKAAPQPPAPTPPAPSPSAASTTAAPLKAAPKPAKAAPKPKLTPKAAPKPELPFRPKGAAELRRGAPMLIEEIEDEDEAEAKAETIAVTAAPATAPPAAAKGTRVTIEEFDEDEEEEPLPKIPKSAAVAKASLHAAVPKAPPAVSVPKPLTKTEEPKARPVLPPMPSEETVAQRERHPRPPSVADTVPTTFFEFEEAWRELRQNDALLTPYLLKIEPTAFKGLFKHSLSYDIIVDVVRCLNGNLPDMPTEETAYHALRVLYNISQVSRFGELVMFMTAPEKAAVAALFTKAERSGMAADKVRKARERMADFGL